jgi:hypothetical protein
MVVEGLKMKQKLWLQWEIYLGRLFFKRGNLARKYQRTRAKTAQAQKQE